MLPRVGESYSQYDCGGFDSHRVHKRAVECGGLHNSLALNERGSIPTRSTCYMINFVVQENLLNEIDFYTLKNALDEINAKYYLVKIIPFDYDFVRGEPSPGFFKTIPVIALGSTTMIRISHTHGWTPGVWDGENFEYSKYIEHYGTEMLNHDAEYYQFKDIPKFEGLKFIRPVKDNKAFAGQVIDGVEFEAWRDRLLELEVTLFPETPTMMAEPTKIDYEYRFFVVNGKVITGSLYHYQGRLMPRALEPEYDFDNSAIAYAQSQVDRWAPAPVFVIDVAWTNKQFKIIEINGFNAAGFYKSDVTKVLQTIKEMYE
jgi:hypothetical protein